MLKLIQLEWKKNNILKYIRNAAIMTAVLSVFVLLMAGELESAETSELYGESMAAAAVELFTNMSYIVFTGVMLSGFIVGAYENKTIRLMFSYPIARQKILLSKMAAVWIFNFAGLVLSKLLLYAVLLLTSPYTRLPADALPIGAASFYTDIFLGSAAMVSVSFASLLAALKKKSSKAVIVASVIIVCFTQGNIGAYTLSQSIPFYALLLILALGSAYLFVRRIETRDVC